MKKTDKENLVELKEISMLLRQLSPRVTWEFMSFLYKVYSCC